MQSEEHCEEAIADYRGRMAPTLANARPEEMAASSVGGPSECEESDSQEGDMFSFAAGAARSQAGSVKGAGRRVAVTTPVATVPASEAATV